MFTHDDETVTGWILHVAVAGRPSPVNVECRMGMQRRPRISKRLPPAILKKTRSSALGTVPSALIYLAQSYVGAEFAACARAWPDPSLGSNVCIGEVRGDFGGADRPSFGLPESALGAGDGGDLCPAIVQYGGINSGKNVTAEVLAI